MKAMLFQVFVAFCVCLMLNVQIVNGTCSKTATAIPGCYSDECGDYCSDSSCRPFQNNCQSTGSLPTGCACIFTNCPYGHSFCSGYVKCPTAYSVCSNNPSVLINGAFCSANGGSYTLGSTSVTENLKVCQYYNPLAPNVETWAPTSTPTSSPTTKTPSKSPVTVAPSITKGCSDKLTFKDLAGTAFGAAAGLCKTFTFPYSGSSIPVCGYNTTTTTVTSTKLWASNSGIGLDNCPSNGICTSGMVQLDVSAIATADDPKFTMGGTKSNTLSYCIYGSNTAGVRGSDLLLTSTSELMQTLPSRFYKYLSFTACRSNTDASASVFLINFQISNSVACSVSPTVKPSAVPSYAPTFRPSSPTVIPTFIESKPSSGPTVRPTTAYPTMTPTSPTATPTSAPTTYKPSVSPSATPSMVPTGMPSYQPSTEPSGVPSSVPTVIPTTSTPSSAPTTASPVFSYKPTTPTVEPTFHPSVLPSEEPTYMPSTIPSYQPSAVPTHVPSSVPSSKPVTLKPSSEPTSAPSISQKPTKLPTYAPTPIAGAPTLAPVYKPTVVPTEVPTIKPSTPTLTPVYAPTDQPTDQPVYQPTILPTPVPTEMPSAAPTEEPTYEPSIHPTLQPSKAPTKRPSRSPTALPTIEPTTIGKGLVDKCTYDINGYYVNSSLYTGYFIVTHVMTDTAAAEFLVPGANETYAETVRCILAGNYSISPVGVNITKLMTPASNSSTTTTSGRRLAGQSSSVTAVQYSVEFQFTIPDDVSVSGALDDVQKYFDGLSVQLTRNMQNQYFTEVLREYASAYGITSFAGSSTTDTPEIVGPFLKTSKPTSPPVAEIRSASNGAALASVWSKLAVILGTISGLLCILFAIAMLYYYYIQRKRSREEEMNKWASEADDADITVHKKYKNDATEGSNPSFKRKALGTNRVSQAMTGVGKAVRRLSTFVGMTSPPDEENQKQADINTFANEQQTQQQQRDSVVSNPMGRASVGEDSMTVDPFSNDDEIDGGFRSSAAKSPYSARVKV